MDDLMKTLADNEFRYLQETHPTDFALTTHMQLKCGLPFSGSEVMADYFQLDVLF